MKKIISLIIALVMVLSMSVPAYADDVAADTDPAAPTELTAAQVKAITPTAKAASYSYTKIKVSWERIEGLDGYKVYRATSKNGKYSLVRTTTSAATTSYINTGRTTGKTYYYKIRGYKKIGKTTYYTKYSAVTSAAPRLSTVKVTKVYLPKDFNTRICWNKVSGATSYQVYRKRTDQSKWKLMKTVSSKYNYATDKMGDVIYFWGRIQYAENDDVLHDWEYKVRAVRESGGKKYYGYFSKPCQYQQDWNIKEIQAELIRYGESFEFPMHAWYDKNGNEVDYMYCEDAELKPKKDGSTYHFEHALDSSANENNSSWSVLWPVEINKYQKKASILKDLKEGVKCELESLATTDPKYWDDYVSYEDYVWGGYNGAYGFGIYYKKQSGHKNTYEIYCFC